MRLKTCCVSTNHGIYEVEDMRCMYKTRNGLKTRCVSTNHGEYEVEDMMCKYKPSRAKYVLNNNNYYAMKKLKF